jgi:hypothetical protein
MGNFLSDIFGGNKPKKPTYVAPNYTKLELAGLDTTYGKFNSQKDNFQDVQDTINESAFGYMRGLEELRPGYTGGLDKAQQIADSLVEGNIPADYALKMSQSSAFKGLTNGLGSQQREFLTERDLATTSLDLMGRGLQMQSNLRNETRSYMPLQALNLAFTPGAIRSEDNMLSQYNNQITNKQAEANANVANMQSNSNYAYDQKYGGNSLTGLLGGAGGGLLGAVGGLAASGGNPMGAMMGFGLGSSLGGGIGGSYGGAQGQGMGSIFQGVGSTASMLGSYGMGGGFGNGFGGGGWGNWRGSNV